MIHELKINIKEILEYNANDSDREEIVKFLVNECMSEKERNEFIGYLLDDLMQSEQEFENRPHLIHAYNTLIDEYKPINNKDNKMKPFTISIIRDIIDKYDRGEISYSRMVELINERAIKYFKIGQKRPHSNVL